MNLLLMQCYLQINAGYHTSLTFRTQQFLEYSCHFAIEAAEDGMGMIIKAFQDTRTTLDVSEL